MALASALLLTTCAKAQPVNYAAAPSFIAMGEISMTSNSTATVNPGAGQYTKSSGTTVSGMDRHFSMPQNNRLQYTADVPVDCHTGATLSATSPGANDIVFAQIFKNGSALTAGTVQQKLFAIGDVSSTAIHVMAGMVKGDYLELFINNATDGDNITITDMNLFAMCTSAQGE